MFTRESLHKVHTQRYIFAHIYIVLGNSFIHQAKPFSNAKLTVLGLIG